MCTDVYGADGLPRRNEMKPGVKQQPPVRCIQTAAWRLLPQLPQDSQGGKNKSVVAVSYR